jgi:hypothetical protein
VLIRLIRLIRVLYYERYSLRPQKEIAPRRPKPSQRNSFHPENRRSDSRDVATSHVHAAVAGFVSRTPAPLKTVLTPAGRRCGMRFHVPPQLPVRHLRRPLVFVVVAVLHRRSTLRRNEARARRRGRLRFSKADQFLRAPPVFIRALQKSLPTLSSRPFGRGAGVRGDCKPLCRRPRTARRRIRPPLPAPVAAPLRTATGRARYSRPCELSRGIFDPFIQIMSLWKKVRLWKKMDAQAPLFRAKTAAPESGLWKSRRCGTRARGGNFLASP